MAVQQRKDKPGSEDRTAWPTPLLLDAQDVARLCRVDRHQALLLMHAAGSVRLGRRVRVRPADLDAYLARLARGLEVQ